MKEKSTIKSIKTRINPFQRILEYNRDPIVRQLMNLYGTPSFFDVLDVSRREMSISSFLADLFREDGFHGMGSLPLMLLLEKVLERAKMQEGQSQDFKQELGIPDKSPFFPALERSILTRTLEPYNIMVNTEVAFSDPGGISGRTDIEIQCDILPLLPDNRKAATINHLTIAVENKISSGEKDSQTEKYFRHYDALLRNGKTKHPRSQYNLYVYLTPLSDEEMQEIPMPNCSCRHFVQINWNDILVGVVEPLLEHPGLSVRARFFLEEFRKSLGISFSDVITSDSGIKPGFQTTVLALNEAQKKKLVIFWKKYRDLIIWAVDEKNRSADYVDTKEDRRKYYTKGDAQAYTMSRMVQAVICEWGSKHTYDEILDVFSNRKRANTNNVITEVNVANTEYYFTDQIFETLDEKKCVVYKLWSQSDFELFIQKAENVGIHIEQYKPVTLSKDDSALLVEFYEKNERLILTALETMRISTPWKNGEDIDAPDVNLREQLEATLRRIRLQKNRKAISSSYYS